MSYAARIAVELVHAWCEKKWPGDGPSDGNKMASFVFDGKFSDVFDFKTFGTHKYIPTEKLNKDLGRPEGDGVFAYVKMYDDSLVLMTTSGLLAHWSGREADAAEWGA